MKIIDKEKFAKANFEDYVEVFLIYITFLLIIVIHPTRKAQIALQVIEKIQILSKYFDFSDVFLEEKALVLPAITNLNQYNIKLQKGQ